MFAASPHRESFCGLIARVKINPVCQPPPLSSLPSHSFLSSGMGRSLCIRKLDP